MKRFGSLRIYLIPALCVLVCSLPALALSLTSIQWLESFSLVYLLACVPFLLIACGVLFLGALILLAVWLTKGPTRGSLPAFVKVCCGIALGLTLSAGLYLGPGWLAQQGIPVGPNYARFDSERWQDPSSSEYGNGISERQKMVSHLVSGVLPGKSREEIGELLGPSLDTPYFSHMAKDFIYYLGPERGIFGVDSEWLVIWIDRDGYFDRYEVMND